MTPSGDDLVLGMLLVLNRWPGLHDLTDVFPQLNRQIVDAANERTTALSANLIACATGGLADERLIDAADSVAAGTPDVLQCVGPLLRWGSSSGVDAFVGMTLAATCGTHER